MPQPVVLDLTDAVRAREVLALQRAAYAVEAELIGFDGIPPLRESLDELMAAPERWLGLLDELGVAAAVAYERLDAAEVEISRLVVAPRAFRRGYGRALVAAVLEREPADRYRVSTGTANAPAVALYTSMGFVPTGERSVAPGVTVTGFELVAPPG